MVKPSLLRRPIPVINQSKFSSENFIKHYQQKHLYSVFKTSSIFLMVHARITNIEVYAYMQKSASYYSMLHKVGGRGGFISSSEAFGKWLNRNTLLEQSSNCNKTVDQIITLMEQQNISIVWIHSLRRGKQKEYSLYAC